MQFFQEAWVFPSLVLIMPVENVLPITDTIIVCADADTGYNFYIIRIV